MVQHRPTIQTYLKASLLALLIFPAVIISPLVAQRRSPFNAAPIFYDTAPVSDPVSRLQRMLNAGQQQLKYDEQHGYLASVLELLNIPQSSQALVFSKTSFQRPHISREQPRAIYFSDNVYIGWVQQGDVIEVSAVDPNLGAVFYSLEQKNVKQPKFQRRIESCMLCHSSSAGARVPGHLVRSIHPNRKGHPLTGSRSYRSTHSSPLAERWGGWYVTGLSGKQRHLGNLVFRNKADIKKNHTGGLNARVLKSFFNNAPYLQPGSDIVALMVLEHQVRMHNLFTAANYETKRALADEQQLEEKDKPQADDVNPLTRLRINKAAEKIVQYMFFCDETKLTEEIKGFSEFQTGFPKRGPHDHKGRSLREFNLQTRMFRYPCSYLIYSEAFTALPKPLKQRIVDRLRDVLSGKDNSETFQHLSQADKTAILEILRSTHKSFK